MKNQTVNNPWIAFLGISLVSFLGCIDFTIVNTALPMIQSDLGVSITQLQWVITIFMLALSACMVVVGRLADIYGRRLLLYIGMLIFAASSLGAGLSPSIHWLIFFRLLQGVGVAILYTVPVAIISNLFPLHKRSKATGILVGVNGFGLVIGPVVGGFIVNALSWRWIFFVNLPIILLGFILCFKTLTESKNTEHGTKIDWLGLILLTVGLPSLVLATVQSTTWGLFPVIGLYVVAFSSLISFYFVENKVESPIINFKLFANRAFISGNIANFSLAFIYTVAFFFIPLYLHNTHGQTSDQMGLTLLAATSMVMILSPVVGHLVNKAGVKKILLLGFLFFIASLSMQMTFSAETPIGFIVLSLIFFGTGWACVLSPSIITAIASVPESASGVAMGSVGTLHNCGGAIGLAIGTLVYHASTNGFNVSMGLLLVIAVLAFLAVLICLKK